MKKKTIFMILIELILLILIIFAYKYIYEVETGKLMYAENSESFVKENKQPVFKIKKIILVSSANAIDNSEGQLKNIDISQYTDIYIEIDNTQKSNEITAENTVNELYIDNIKIETNSSKGEKIFNYKNPLSNGKYLDIANYRNDGILFKVLRSNDQLEEVNYDENIFYTDCSNPISLGYINKNLLTGCEVNSTNGSIVFDGTILKSANVDLEEISPEISFTIHITNNYNEQFACNLTIDNDLASNKEDGIYTGYVMKILNTEDEKYNFLKVSD